MLQKPTAVSSGKTGSYNLTQTDFLSLLTTELAFQDPTSPTDNKEMVSQLAQISTVDGINKLNGTVGGLSDIVTSQQALMVSGLVGQTVLLDQNTGYSSGTGFAGVVNTGDLGASNITVTVMDAVGSIVYQAQSEGNYEGNVPFSWNGTTDIIQSWQPEWLMENLRQLERRCMEKYRAWC